MILTGPPGAGKGSQAPKIVNKLTIPQLSTGDMLRAAVANKTEVGMKAKAAMDSGALVSDDIVIGIISDRIREIDCGWGFILDGFPRNVAQTKALDGMLAKNGEKVNSVVSLEIPDEKLEDRICGRWIHKPSGRSFHATYEPSMPKSLKAKPKGTKADSTNMFDDETGEPLVQRSDDTPTALKNRLEKFHSETVPVLTHYEPLGIVSHVDASGSKSAVWAQIDPAIGNKAV